MTFGVAQQTRSLAVLAVLGASLATALSLAADRPPASPPRAASQSANVPPRWLQGHRDKKGICLGGGEGGRTWGQTIRLLHAWWVYDWGLHPAGAIPKGVHYIPMVWGHAGEETGDTTWLTDKFKKHIYEYLLTFNEPDNSTQSNMPVKTALKLWPQLQSTGMIIGSPACVHPGGLWMRQFMQAAARLRYRVNFVCVHWYGPPDPAQFLGEIAATYRLYHRPIWITEFAVADWGASRQRPNAYSQAAVVGFLRVVIPVLDRLGYVQCYAWYPYGGTSRFTALGCSGLFDKKGNLTAVGRAYARY